MLELAISAFDGLVVNRPLAGESNDAKPWQTALLAQAGFHVPRSCTTNEAAAARDFIASCRHGAIYKSNSGTRSIVQAVTADDVDRLGLLAACPVYFQERIWGADVRVHVVRDRCHAVLIRAPAVDYRYDTSGEATEEPYTIASELATRCVHITAAMGLQFSGIDFIRADDGTFYCLEVNPMPGYHGYDLTLSYAISESLGDLLFAA
jgi:glutathione synthase/RimK-type ligase-like ATP-grasp enzyme